MVVRGRRLEIIRSLLNIIIKNCMYEYARFIDFIADVGSDEDFEVACDEVVLFDTYLQSRYRIAEEEMKLELP